MIYEKITLDEASYIEVYAADKLEHFTRKAILVVPGGGYCEVCADREGEPVAHAFLSRGYNAFVLHYSVDGKKLFPSQLIQASAAMKYIKDNAGKYNIDPENVFTVGFSAGGHLAASLAVMWNKKEIYESIPMPYGYNRPKGAMLIYPVISGVDKYGHTGSFKNLLGMQEPDMASLEQASIERNMSSNAAPVFMAHAADDNIVPVQNSLILANAYAEKNIPFELHIYPRGGHGFALGNKITWIGNEEYTARGLCEWVDAAAVWADSF